MLAAVLPLLLAACAAPPALPTAAQLDILIPGGGLGPASPGGDWVLAGVGNGETAPRLTPVQIDGVPAMRVAAGEGRLTALRQVRAPLLATPFLTWSWHVSPTRAAAHPVHLVAGFQSVAEPAAAQRRQSATAPLPAHDRQVTLVFAASALQRGSLARLEGPADGGVYTVRGGPENADTWWVETVDLEDLYRRLWPTDDPAWVEVVFIGVQAEPASGGQAANLSGILLSR